MQHACRAHRQVTSCKTCTLGKAKRHRLRFELLRGLSRTVRKQSNRKCFWQGLRPIGVIALPCHCRQGGHNLRWEGSFSPQARAPEAPDARSSSSHVS